MKHIKTFENLINESFFHKDNKLVEEIIDKVKKDFNSKHYEWGFCCYYYIDGNRKICVKYIPAYVEYYKVSINKVDLRASKELAEELFNHLEFRYEHKNENVSEKLSYPDKTVVSRIISALETDEFNDLTIDRGIVEFNFDDCHAILTALDSEYKLELTKGYQIELILDKEIGRKIFNLAIDKHEDQPF